ncbi:hypothetical protein DVP82_03630 [Yersinia enterocolitica]|nr:hypothetical protein [Yersinia enterocolitica]EKN5940084.1 hypothetical protein [Yersinia enterocolitica]EKN6223409.1 hypothetical protein [Yersinia enterocolitica]
MAKAHSTPLNDIAIIAANLKDRYKNGFPVLKEIVQNADDAKASSLILGWSPGISGADHPLLADPALFFINNAPLSEEDVKGILSIGIGTKPGDNNAVGKFGLGMKSLFHLGEVFFYQAFDWRTTWAKSDVFNPWDSYRSAWAEVSEQDKVRLEDEVRAITQNECDDYFVVWVPLRSDSIYQARDDDDNFIIVGEDYRHEVPDFIVDPGLGDKLASLLPLMKTLQDIELVVNTGQGYQRQIHISLPEKASRPLFTRLDGAGDWQGHITVQRFGSQSPQQKFYVGHEVLLNTPDFSALKSHRTWPFSYSREGKKTADKALPHAAVVMLAEKVPEGEATLTVEWAVFLPLGEQDTAQNAQKQTFSLTGQYSYQIILHGYFFIDAGRVGIQGLSTLTSPAPLFIAPDSPSQEQLVQEWNRCLATQGTLPLLPKALASLMSLIHVGDAEKAAISDGVRRALRNNNSWLHWVTLYHLWVCELTRDGSQWCLVDANTPVRLLPATPSGEAHRPWEVLPALESLGVTHRFIDETQQNIYNEFKSKWPLSEIQALLQAIPLMVFTAPKLTSYLNQLLKALPNASDNYSRDLISLLRKTLSGVPLVELSRNQAAIGELMALIRPTWRYRIAIDRQEQALWETLGRTIMDTLLVPAFLDNSKEPASASLNWETVGSLLQAMQAQASASDDFEKLVRDFIGKLSAPDRLELYRRFDTLKIFKVSQPTGVPYLETRRHLLDLKQKRRVFKRGGSANFGMGLSALLQQALIEKEVVLITNDINQTLFGGSEYSEAQECDSEGVVHLLELHPRLDLPAKRIDLLNKMAAEGDKFGPRERLSYRYLMHGNAADTGETELWKAGKAHPVWAKILSDADSEQLKWTIISPEIEQNLGLTPGFEKALRLDSVTPDHVIQSFKESLEYLDFDDLSAEDAEEVLLHIGRSMGETMWRQMALHRREGKDGYISLDERCFLRGGSIELPTELNDNVTFIQSASQPEVQEQQRKYLPMVNAEHAVMLALSEPNPERYCDFILQLLMQQPNDLSSERSFTTLRRQKWLLHRGVAISPENILNISATDYPEIAKLTEATPLIALLEDIVLPDDANRAVSPLIVQGKAAFYKALTAASTHPLYAIGNSLRLTDTIILQASDRSYAFDNFDGWRLLIECFKGAESLEGNEAINALSFAHPVTDKIVSSYQRLVDSMNPTQSGELRKALLSTLCHTHSDPASVLRSIPLRTAADTWALATDLCYGVTGAERSAVLHDDDWAFLSPWLQANDLSVDSSESEGHLSYVEHSASVLREYFAPWERWVPRKAIAALLALLAGNRKVRKLCESYLGLQSYALFVNELSQDSKPLTNHDAHFAGLTLLQCIEKYAFAVKVYEENTLQVHSLFQERLTVALATDLDTIFVGQHGYAFYTGEAPQIFIRRFSPEQYTSQQLLAILKRSTNWLLEGIYLQRIRLDALWQSFEQAEQLDVNIARVTILSSIVERLKTLGLKNSQLNVLMRAYESELHSLAEKSDGKLLHSSRLTEIVYEIADAIRDRPELQAEILTAVRKRIEDAQYQPSSVPFELFQNADDAVEELFTLDSDTRHERVHQKFMVKEQNGGLSFFNWGREINRFQSVKNEKAENIHDGYKNDLKKMLALYQSDKEQGVTGKFGLGFKSCLLVSDNPYLLSGRLATKIAGGIVPESCDAESYKQLNHLTESAVTESLSPTLVHLPLRQHMQAEAVLKDFTLYAGLLSLYARNLRQIIIDDHEWRWEPVLYARIPGLSSGKIVLPNSKGVLSPVRVVVYQTAIDDERCHLVFQITRKGLRGFDTHIPRLWNLSPLMSDTRQGFLINAGFEVDIGRRQLAIEADRNRGIIQKAGAKVHSLLELLWRETEHNWEALAAEWELSSELTHSQFWESVWDVMSMGISNDATAMENEKLLQQLYESENGIMSFYRSYPALPNGFKDQAGGLIKWSDRVRCADELVSRLASSLIHLPAFQTLHSAQCLVGDTTGSKLKVDNKLSLESLLSASLPDKQGVDIQHLSPQDAEKLAVVFNEEFDKRLGELTGWQDKIEAFRKQLANLYVQTQAGSTRPISQILLGNTPCAEKNERLISGFAPSDAIISSSYSKQACEFIVYCKRRSQGYVFDDLLKWAKRKDLAADNQKRQAFCRFLIEGLEGEKLAGMLMEEIPPDWLLELKLRPGAFPADWHWSNNDIASLLQGRLLTNSDRTRALEREICETPEEYKPLVTPGEAVQKIYRWWEENQQEELAKYNTRLYPEGWFDWEALRNGSDDQRSRMALLKLLYLGSCQTIGRTQEEQHRAAIEHFEEKGWWETFIDPGAAQQWLDVMDDYLEDSLYGDTYRIWLQILPLYRFSKHLYTYGELLNMSEAFLEDIGDLLRPASSFRLSGTRVGFVPELRATLGTGVNFIFRELVRNNVFTDSSIHRYCFSAPERVRRLLLAMEFDEIDIRQSTASDSLLLWTFFSEHLGEEDATFNHCFDIPLRILTSDGKRSLRIEIFGQDPLDYV